MDINMLQKRIHKLLIISVMMVLSILVMAFLFIDHGDDSLNHATYTTMNQEIDLCKQRISSQKHTDFVLLNTWAKSLSNKYRYRFFVGRNEKRKCLYFSFIY